MTIFAKRVETGPVVTLVIGRIPTGEMIRLTPKSGPIGYVLCTNANGNTVARFDSKAVLKWLDRKQQQQTE